MSVGLIALLDDVAAIAKAAASTLDDVAAQSLKAGTKSAGVVIDDAAVTPRYVVGFAAERELPIVIRIARGSLRNKLLILLPAALGLGLVAPFLITPLLMLGGSYLCYEGAEKVLEAVLPHHAARHEEDIGVASNDPMVLENQRVEGAIRTDFILSAEIMAIALAAVPESGFWTQAIVLAVVAVGITGGVYGAVALIVKADDAGLALGRNTGKTVFARLSRFAGGLLVRGMPSFLTALATAGTAAMVWVGGGILLHGLESFGVDAPAHAVAALSVGAAEAVPALSGLVGWLVSATGAGIAGLAAGALLIPLVQYVIAPLWARIRALRAAKP